MSEKVVLVSCIGTAPAVLTGTVWALAHEQVPVIPDEIVCITTLKGKEVLEDQLLRGAVWDQLLDALKQEGIATDGRLAFGASDSIRVIGDGRKDFEDVSSPEQNQAAADFILKVLREHTENPGTKVLASIAGGRKTMSALMLACMSLLGREQDRACHLLVNEPYEQRMDPPYFFPQKGIKHRLNGKVYLSAKADPVLCDIPFVRTRGWYEEEISAKRRSSVLGLFKFSEL